MNGVSFHGQPYIAPAPAFRGAALLLLVGLGLITCIALVVLFGGGARWQPCAAPCALAGAGSFAVHYSKACRAPR
ncbi:MAG: hypothetical protein H6643_03625 [Caldilineaceae bacterium]|nr:hypothetical protein [Caldilineaceae bacterium]